MPDVAAYPLLRAHARRRRRWPRRRAVAHLRLARRCSLVGWRRWRRVVWASAAGAARPGTRAGRRAHDAGRGQLPRRASATRRSRSAPTAIGGAAQLALARAQLELGDGLAAEAALDRARAAGRPAAALHALRRRSAAAAGRRRRRADRGRAAAPQAPGWLRRSPRRGAGRARATGPARSGAARRSSRPARATRAAWTRSGAAALDAGRCRRRGGRGGDARSRLAPGEPAALTLRARWCAARFGLVAALPWFEAALARDAYYHPALIEYAATLGEPAATPTCSRRRAGAASRGRAARRRSTCRR